MEIYLLIVVVLFVLAVSDLVVGVSNDAVNFLNSAIGSMVANRTTILIVASLGIFLGATFSSGMMEVARKGVFFPGQFYFSEIMIIFVAVMMTDIFLLDLFNTFGLPTSTTVSIVFELLGASVCVAIIKIARDQSQMSTITEYINADNALLIIGGIFLSIAFAFTLGAIVQLFSRLLFSFHYRKHLNYIGSFWSAIALTAMIYFLFIKGLQGASFIDDETVLWVERNALSLMAGSVIVITLILQMAVSLRKVNIFRIVVLFGTFSLAMAFAGNDLVNFIGVPIAGLESFLAWSQSGAEADGYSMGILSQPVRANTLLLLAAGIIMIITLWTSKKARSVTDTEVNLGRQDEGFERFSANPFARFLVRNSLSVSKFFITYLPQPWKRAIKRKYEVIPDKRISPKTPKPAFDLVRASVNLAVASILIAFATSLKLPLSTTYVSFMVAMGTSLSDQAWGRESAVYRISGVLHVVGGWLVTALIAFTVSGLLAFIIFQFGLWMIPVIIVFIGMFIYYTFKYHRQSEEKRKEREIFDHTWDGIPDKELYNDLSKAHIKSLLYVENAYNHVVNALLNEDLSQIKLAKNQIKLLKSQNEKFNEKLYRTVRRINLNSKEAGKFFIKVYDYELELIKSISYIQKVANIHVSNVHLPLKPCQQERIDQLTGHFNELITNFIDDLKIGNEEIANEQFISKKQQILQYIDDFLEEQIMGIQSGEFNIMNNQLYLNFLLETRDLIAVIARIAKQFRKYRKVADLQIA